MHKVASTCALVVPGLSTSSTTSESTTRISSVRPGCRRRRSRRKAVQNALHTVGELFGDGLGRADGSLLAHYAGDPPKAILQGERGAAIVRTENRLEGLEVGSITTQHLSTCIRPPVLLAQFSCLQQARSNGRSSRLHNVLTHRLHFGRR